MAAGSPLRHPAARDLAARAGDWVAARAGSPAAWTDLLDSVAPNLRLGWTSAVLAAAAQPGLPEPVATAEEWKRAGWQVRAGEQVTTWIIRETGELRWTARAYTARQMHPAPGTRPSRWPVPPPIGPDADVQGGLTAFAATLGYEMTGSASELAHRLAHIIAAGRPPGGYQADACFGQAAAVADSVAWLVLRRLGADPAAAGLAFQPPQTWAAGTDQLMASGEQITAAAARIAAHAAKVIAPLPPPLPGPAAPAPREASRERPVTRSAFRPALSPRPATHPAPAPAPMPAQPDPGIVRVNEAAAAYFTASLPRSWAAAYLDRRGLNAAIRARWGLGYAPRGWTTLLTHLLGEGYDEPALVAAGLAARTATGMLMSVFRDRVMFPWRDINGNLVGFAGRARAGASSTVPKYLNTRETSVFRKDQMLFGLWEARDTLRAGARPGFVEGYTDAIAVSESGGQRLAGLATGGTGLSRWQMAALNMVCDLRQVSPLVARDADKAGRRAAARDYQVIVPWSLHPGASDLAAGTDPAEIFERDGPAALMSALTEREHPLADVAADVAVDDVLGRWDGSSTRPDGGLLADPAEVETQLGAIRAAVRELARIPGPPLPWSREIARIAWRTGLPYSFVQREAIAVIAPPEPGQDGDYPGPPHWEPAPGQVRQLAGAPSAPGAARGGRRAAPARRPLPRPGHDRARHR